MEWGTERGTERVPEIRGTKLRSVLWSFFQSYLWQIWKWQPWKMNWYFFRKWLLFIKMFYFLFRLDDHGAFKTHILAKKIVSLNCLFLQRNGNGTTVPLLWNEERRMRSFYQIWNEERNAFLFSARNEERNAFLKSEERNCVPFLVPFSLSASDCHENANLGKSKLIFPQNFLQIVHLEIKW